MFQVEVERSHTKGTMGNKSQPVVLESRSNFLTCKRGRISALPPPQVCLKVLSGNSGPGSNAVTCRKQYTQEEINVIFHIILFYEI